MRNALAILLMAAWALAPRAAHAQAPALLTESGVLFDGDGDPVTTAVAMVFSLYTAPTGTSAVWTETHTVTPDEGVFSVVLGQLTTLDPTLFGGGPMYLGVRVGTDSEMTPREALVSVPYALRADTAEDAVGDIHPASVSVDGALVIDGAGRWVGDPTGLAGPTGPQGEDGIVAIAKLYGPLLVENLTSPTYVFWGPTITVTVEPGQRVTASLSAAVRGTAGEALYYAICYRLGPTGPPVHLGNMSSLVGFSTDAFVTLSMDATSNPNDLVGTYSVGLCATPNGGPVVYGNYVSGWVMIHN